MNFVDVTKSKGWKSKVAQEKIKQNTQSFETLCLTWCSIGRGWGWNGQEACSRLSLAAALC